MGIIHAEGRLYVRRANGEWHDCGEAKLTVETEETSDRIAFMPPRSFEVTLPITWQRWAPFALSLPPIGCMPMWN